MILLIDNYDSFSFNLYQYIGEFNSDIKVIRNNELTIKEIEELNPQAIIISPGPGKPKDAGIIEEVIKYFSDKKPVLGICLGHQAICEAFGGTITYAKEIMHGKTSKVKLDNSCEIFSNLPEYIQAGRYHSLVAQNSTLPDCLKVTAKTENDVIMAVKHKEYNVYGLQFHPESILTPEGKTIIYNFLRTVK